MTAPEAYDMVLAPGPVDIRRLGSIRVPTLLLHRSGDRWVEVHTGPYMAERIPGAKLVELPGDDHWPGFVDQDAVVALTQEFLTGALPVLDPDRILPRCWPTSWTRPGWRPSWGIAAGTAP